MTRRDWWLGIIAVCSTILGAGALPARGQVVRDPSTLECGTWLKLRTTDGSIFSAFTMSATAWMQGYFNGAFDLGFTLANDVHGDALTAVQHGAAAIASLRRADDIPRGIDDYCAANPDHTLGTMTMGLLRKAYRP